jgi:hypothetical protein
VRRELNYHKESKSLGCTSIRDLRAFGYTPEEIKHTLQACFRDSFKAGNSDIVIPDGIMGTETHGVMSYNWAKENWTPGWNSQGLKVELVGEEAFEAAQSYIRMMIDRMER